MRRLLPILMCLLYAPVILASGIAFRYLPGRPDVSSAVISKNLEVGPLLEISELRARGPGGWGMPAPQTAEFDGETTFLYGADSTVARLFLGPQFTAEVWLLPSDAGGTQYLLSNQQNSEASGFTLMLQDGVPQFTFLLDTLQLNVSGTEALAADEKHWLAATVDYADNTLYVALYHNGIQIAKTSTPRAAIGRYDLKRRCFVGSQPMGNPQQIAPKPTFTGHVFGATLRMYTASELYLTAKVPFDGGPFFGKPAFHEYPLDSGALPGNLRLVKSETQLEEVAYVPYANDLYILQGVAARLKSDGNTQERLLYLSFYHRLRNGTIETQKSIVAELALDDGARVRRCFRLQGELTTAHVGGVAWSHGGLWVASRGILERYPVPEYDIDDPQKYVDLQPDRSSRLDVPGSASFVSSEADTLWVGDFRWPNESQGFMYGYLLTSEGKPAIGFAPQVFAVPKRVQGVDFFTWNGQRFCFMSLSGGSATSDVLRVRAQDLNSTTPPPVDTTFVLPRGGEDLGFFPDGTLWSGSESGADYFQKRSNPWPQFFPFIYGISPETLFGDLGPRTAVKSDAQETFAVRISHAPNPVRNHLAVRISLPQPRRVTLSIYDSLGRHVQTAMQNRHIARSHALQIDTQRFASGVYYLRLRADAKSVVRKFVVQR